MKYFVHTAISLLVTLIPSANVLAEQAKGFDPGMKVGNAEIIRKSQTIPLNRPDIAGKYIIEAVAEQGGAAHMDQRPFEVWNRREIWSTFSHAIYDADGDSIPQGLQTQYNGQNYVSHWMQSKLVSPFHFKWINDGPGYKRAEMFVNTWTNRYIYTRHPQYNTGNWVGRDKPRDLYFPLPYTDISGLTDVKNSLDDGVFLSIREADDRNGSGYQFDYNNLHTLKQNFKLWWDQDYWGHIQLNLDRLSNNPPSKAGGRVLATLEWEKADENRIYLVEINLASASNVDSWVSSPHPLNYMCISDTDSYSSNEEPNRRYLILSGHAVFGESVPKAVNRTISLNWGDILQTLASSYQHGTCGIAASALTNIKPNSLKIGIAQEVKGALRQRVRYSKVTITQ